MKSLLNAENRKQLKIAHRVGAVGLEMVLATALGYFGGGWLDDQLGTTPYLAYAGLCLGVIAGFNGLHYLVKRLDLDAM